MEGEKKERIKPWMAACMIIVALCVDGMQVLLFFLGPITSVAAYFGFWIWFMLLKVPFTASPKKLLTMGATAIGEFFLGFLPVFTAGIATVVFMTVAEDKGGLLGKLAGAAQGNIAGAMRSPTPQFAFARQESNMKRFQPKTSSPDVSSRPAPKTTEQAVPKPNPSPMAPQIASDSSYAGYKQPDWMRDKSVDEAMKLRKQRADVADRLGMSKEQSAKHVLDAEDRDYARRKVA